MELEQQRVPSLPQWLLCNWQSFPLQVSRQEEALCGLWALKRIILTKPYQPRGREKELYRLRDEQRGLCKAWRPWGLQPLRTSLGQWDSEEAGRVGRGGAGMLSCGCPGPSRFLTWGRDFIWCKTNFHTAEGSREQRTGPNELPLGSFQSH